MTAHLQGGQGLRQEWLSAVLVLKPKGDAEGDEYRLVASGVKLDNGRNPVFTFPSIQQIDRGKLDWKKSTLELTTTLSTPWKTVESLDPRVNKPLIYLETKAAKAETAKAEAAKVKAAKAKAKK